MRWASCIGSRRQNRSLWKNWRSKVSVILREVVVRVGYPSTVHYLDYEQVITPLVLAGNELGGQMVGGREGELVRQAVGDW